MSASSAWAQGEPAPTRNITRIAENLYQAQDGGFSTVFLVSEDGIILADPLNTQFAEWLKIELAERFNATVQYVIYSHHHWDHASGGAVFADTARFVGHERMLTALDRELPLYGPSVVANKIDGNNDGRANRQELASVTPGFSLLTGLSVLDTDNDGELTGEEINVDILSPEIVYSDHMKITLGDQTVELLHSYPAHSEDMTVLFFPEQRAAFAVDFVNVRRLPPTLIGFAPSDVVAAIAEILELDIDFFIPGHGTAGTRQDLADYVDMLRSLQASVSAGIERGLALSELQDAIDLEDYSDWLLYDRRAALLADVYATLREH